MILFGKRPATYASDAGNHKPVGLFNCSACGAAVTEANKAVHEEWHDTIESRIKAVEDKPPVVINAPPVTSYPTVAPLYTSPSYGASPLPYISNTGNNDTVGYVQWSFDDDNKLSE